MSHRLDDLKPVAGLGPTMASRVRAGRIELQLPITSTNVSPATDQQAMTD
jgi:hypothetical protein